AGRPGGSRGARRTRVAVGRTAGRRRRGQPARSAAAGDAWADRRRTARAHETWRGPDPGIARRHRRRGRAGPGAAGRSRPAGSPAAAGGPAPPPVDTPLRRPPGEPPPRGLSPPPTAGAPRQSAALLFRAAWQNVERVIVRQEPALHRVY